MNWSSIEVRLKFELIFRILDVEFVMDFKLNQRELSLRIDLRKKELTKLNSFEQNFMSSSFWTHLNWISVDFKLLNSFEESKIAVSFETNIEFGLEL